MPHKCVYYFFDHWYHKILYSRIKLYHVIKPSWVSFLRLYRYNIWKYFHSEYDSARRGKLFRENESISQKIPAISNAKEESTTGKKWPIYVQYYLWYHYIFKPFHFSYFCFQGNFIEIVKPLTMIPREKGVKPKSKKICLIKAETFEDIELLRLLKPCQGIVSIYCDGL